MQKKDNDSKGKPSNTYPEGYQGLPVKHISQAADSALADINQERSGEQYGLYCAWNNMNRGMGKYWRFSHVTQLAAPSKHGKSYAINQLHDHFTDFEDVLNEDKSIYSHAINKNYKGKVVVIHFGLEMDASDEVIRNISRKIVKSHNYILSSEWDDATEAYNQISDAEFNMIENRMHYVRNKPIYYVEMAGTVGQIYYTVQHIQSLHKGCRLVISIDHTLLVRRGESERTDGDLIAAVAYLALRLRKDFKAMVILLSQFNQNILSVERLTNSTLHYPQENDIYNAAKVNWVCDNIWAFPYRPELLNITKYGVDKINTEGLVIASCIKSRKGSIGECYFEDRLSVGKFVEITLEKNSE